MNTQYVLLILRAVNLCLSMQLSSSHHPYAKPLPLILHFLILSSRLSFI